MQTFVMELFDFFFCELYFDGRPPRVDWIALWNVRLYSSKSVSQNESLRPFLVYSGSRHQVQTDLRPAIAPEYTTSAPMRKRGSRASIFVLEGEHSS